MPPRKEAKAGGAPRPPVTPATTPTLENYTIVEVHRSKLKNAPYNPRILTDNARRKLKAGIQKLGLLAPPVWNEVTGHIVSGHQRISILDTLKGSADYTLKVAQVKLSETEEKEANLLLNNPEAQGEWDLEKLEQILHTDGIELDATGFDVADVYRLFGDAPMSASTEMEEMADRLRSAREGYENARDAPTARDSESFYIVVVFKDEADCGAFLKDHGLDDNRFQDGRVLRRLIAEGVPTKQSPAEDAAVPSPEASTDSVSPARPLASGRQKK